MMNNQQEVPSEIMLVCISLLSKSHCTDGQKTDRHTSISYSSYLTVNDSAVISYLP